jgi:pimeloyl-ACP methyl ester carboxylesterase
MARVVLVHGAWHGSWAWERVVPLLREAGHEPVAVDLPSAGGTGNLADDAALVREVIEQSTEPTVVVAHSYGGIPTTVATAGLSQVQHLVYVCAFLLDRDESLLGAIDHVVPPWIGVDEEAGVSRVLDPMTAFYLDVDPADAEAAVARLRTQTLASFADPVTAAGWHEIDSTYVLCTQDQAIPYVAQQAMSARAGTVHTMESSHSPFLSQPRELVTLLEAALG